MEETDASSELKATSRRRRWLRRGILAVGLLFLLVAVPLAILRFVGVEFDAPDWVSDRVETEIQDRMGGGRLDVGRMEILFDKSFAPKVRMRNVGVFDRNGAEIAQLNQLTAKPRPGRLMQGGVALQEMQLSGAQITVRRGVDGQFDLSFGTGGGASGDLASVLASVADVFDNEPFNELDELLADTLTITLEDARTGRLWQVTDGSILLQQKPATLDVTVSADVFNGTEELAETVIGFNIEKGSGRASLTASFENAAASDIAAQSPVLAFLGVLDAQISGALRTSFDANGQIENLAGTLQMSEGALQPTSDTPPIAFSRGQGYMEYEAETRTLSFSELSFESEQISLNGGGTAILQDFRAGWPGALVGQFQVTNIRLQPPELFAQPMTFTRGATDFRLRLDPFAVDIGQISLGAADQRLLASGRVRTDANGWDAALDFGLNQMPRERILELWPVSLAKGARNWVEKNVLDGQVSDLSGALRLSTGQEPRFSLNFVFDQATVQALRFLPPVTEGAGYASMEGSKFTVVVEAGKVAAEKGGEVDVAGTVFHVGNLGKGVDRAEVSLRATSTITAALSLLNRRPLSVMDKAKLPPDVTNGRAEVRGLFEFDLLNDLKFEDVAYSAEGSLRNVVSSRLIKARDLTARALSFVTNPEGVEISGNAAIDGLPVNGVWTQKFGEENRGRSRVEGSVELSQKFLDTFNIGLPLGSVSGVGVAQIEMDLVDGQAPRFSLQSDLNRVGLQLEAVNWSKPRNQTGTLEVAGRLGEVPSINRLLVRAPGLSASGVIDLNGAGSLDTAQFDRVRIGDWLDGPVTLTGRGANAAPAVAINGGTVDMRRAEISGGSGTGSEGGPMTLRLNRLTVSEGIALTDFRGSFRAGRGLNGEFSALVNGKAPIRGTAVSTPAGAAVNIVSDRAGSVLAAAGILNSARGGLMDLSLNPSGAEGTYNGTLNIKNTRIVQAPAMTELLNAISIVGLIDQMNTGGITLTDVQAEFQLSPELLTLLGSSAVGPSIGVSLDGRYNLRTDRLDMQGVISPVYFLNGIGQLFSRRREGLFGFNFRLGGTAENPRVSVNPLSILTPGAFREIFRRPPPEPVQSQ